MRAQRSRAASIRLSALLLSGVLAWPVYGQDLPVAPPAIGSDPVALGIVPPDPPPSVSISPSDLRPGEDAKEAVSRLLAEPDPAPNGASGPVRRAPALDPLSTASVVHPAATMTQNGAPAPIAPRVGIASPAPPLALASVPDIAPSPPVALPASKPTDSPSPVSAPPPSVSLANPASATVLDAPTLQKALDAYVGAEPVPPIGGRVPAAEQARYKDRQAVRALYAARQFSPVWIDNGTFNDRARSVLGRIDHAAEDGLDLHVAALAAPAGADAVALAAAELAVTESAAAYGRQASGGRVDPARIGALIGAKPDVADAARVLAALVAAPDAGAALRAFNPPQKGYDLLRSKLAELRQAGDAETRVIIPYGPTLKTGMRDPRVPLIRARFGLDMGPDGSVETGLVYDTQVASAVADFQKAHHLPASGVLTIRTVAALSGGDPRRLEDDIIANMERWRWLPRDMGENRIEVNIPDFSVNVMHGDAVFHHARVVVGKPDKPTPLFSETMRFIIVNPYWNVPLSIVKKEMMPKLAQDPDYFANHGYETVERDGQTYVRQPPGDSNALGRIKFMFPNAYSVYLHDTNARALFGSEKRAFSHGCVRVDAPFKFAEAVLGRDNGWTEARVKRLVGGDERTINLPRPLPIHIVYFTTFVDETGTLQTRDDVYGYSEKLKAALGLQKGGQIAAN